MLDLAAILEEELDYESCTDSSFKNDQLQNRMCLPQGVPKANPLRVSAQRRRWPWNCTLKDGSVW